METMFGRVNYAQIIGLGQVWSGKLEGKLSLIFVGEKLSPNEKWDNEKMIELKKTCSMENPSFCWEFC